MNDYIDKQRSLLVDRQHGKAWCGLLIAAAGRRAVEARLDTGIVIVCMSQGCEVDMSGQWQLLMDITTDRWSLMTSQILRTACGAKPGLGAWAPSLHQNLPLSFSGLSLRASSRLSLTSWGSHALSMFAEGVEMCVIVLQNHPVSCAQAIFAVFITPLSQADRGG